MLSLVNLAISKSSKRMYLLVYFKIAGTSEAIKLPSGEFATIKGLVHLKAYMALGSSLQIMPKA